MSPSIAPGATESEAPANPSNTMAASRPIRSGAAGSRANPIAPITKPAMITGRLPRESAKRPNGSSKAPLTTLTTRKAM